ncbi:MAG: hypothetical protein SPF59_07605 [Oscillospiraceae bacterium]|nr:hypothetical protein [Oscillospiraceae bacterium]
MELRFPEHPDVALALRGGSPVCARARQLRCSACGAPLEPWEEAYLWSVGRRREPVCGDCFDLLLAALDRREQARMLGVEVLQ